MAGDDLHGPSLPEILKQKQTFAMGVYVLLAICFITENMLDRYQGLIFIAFILPLSSKVVSVENVDHSSV